MTLICLFKKNKKNKKTTIQIRGEEVRDNNVFKKKKKKPQRSDLLCKVENLSSHCSQRVA